MQSIPNSIINKLHEIFQNEIKRQNEEMNYQITIQDEVEMQKMITYNQVHIQNVFNQILFNLLFKQIKRNV